jgi:hypothetical protein
LAAVYYNYDTNIGGIYISNDYGVSWTNSNSINTQWQMVVSNYNGDKLAVISNSYRNGNGDIIGGIYTYTQPEISVCFKNGTQILTPDGYKLIETLKANDLVINSKEFEAIEIKQIVHFQTMSTITPLYCLPANSLGNGIPFVDLYMSGSHAFKDLEGKWHHMQCATNTHLVDQDKLDKINKLDKLNSPLPTLIDYYHIITSDYFSHTLIASGVEVETCFKKKNNKVSIFWVCSQEYCLLLKYKLYEQNKENKLVILKNKLNNMISYIYNPSTNTRTLLAHEQIDL